LKKKRFLSAAFLLILLSLVWITLTPVFFPNTQADAAQTAVHRGFYAPDFTLETPQGVTHTLADYQGKPVLVFFWASWCSVCKSAMPGLEAVYQDYSPQGFRILAVNTTNQDTLSTAEAYFQSQRYAFTMLLDQDGAVADLYRMRAVPTSVLIDPEGRVTDVIIGSGISEGFLRARLESLLMKSEE
jgi:thiol-disulfide isomerase/thioredoxin